MINVFFTRLSIIKLVLLKNIIIQIFFLILYMIRDVISNDGYVISSLLSLLIILIVKKY